MAASSGFHGDSGDRFGYSWDAFQSLTPEQEEQFRRWTALISPDEWRDKRFLDVGCGMGRNSYWAMKLGASGGRAVDIDERTLAAARRNLASFPSVDVMLQSAYEIDAIDEFDIVFSIGVIHHLEAPERALERLVMAARPGGKVLIWVYGRENNDWLVYLFDPLRRYIFSRLPIAVLHRLSGVPAAILWLVLRLGAARMAYLRMLRGFPFAHLRHIVFDHMLPRIARYLRGSEVRALMEQAGLENVRLEWVNQMSWSAVGIKPNDEKST